MAAASPVVQEVLTQPEMVIFQLDFIEELHRALLIHLKGMQK
jgi:hypothetical protein